MSLHEYPKRRKTNEDEDKEKGSKSTSKKDSKEVKKTSANTEDKHVEDKNVENKNVEDKPVESKSGDEPKTKKSKLKPETETNEKSSTEENKANKENKEDCAKQNKEENASPANIETKNESSTNVQKSEKEAPPPKSMNEEAAHTENTSTKKNETETKKEKVCDLPVATETADKKDSPPENKAQPNNVDDKLPKESASNKDLVSEKDAEKETSSKKPEIKESTDAVTAEPKTKKMKTSENQPKEKESSPTGGEKSEDIKTPPCEDASKTAKSTSAEQPQSELLVKINIADHQLEIKEKVNNENSVVENQADTSSAKTKTEEKGSEIAPDQQPKDVETACENNKESTSNKKSSALDSIETVDKKPKTNIPDKVDVNKSATVTQSKDNKEEKEDESKKKKKVCNEVVKKQVPEIENVENGTADQPKTVSETTVLEKQTGIKETANTKDCKSDNLEVNKESEEKKISKNKDEKSEDLAKAGSSNDQSELKETETKVHSQPENITSAETVNKKVDIDKGLAKSDSQSKTLNKVTLENETKEKKNENCVNSQPTNLKEVSATEIIPEVRDSASEIEVKLDTTLKENSENSHTEPKENSSVADKPPESAIEENTENTQTEKEKKEDANSKECQSDKLMTDTEKQVDPTESAKVLDNQTEVENTTDKSSDKPNDSILNNCVETSSHDNTNEADKSNKNLTESKDKLEVRISISENPETETIMVDESNEVQKATSSTETVSENEANSRNTAAETTENSTKADYEPPAKKRAICVNLDEKEIGLENPEEIISDENESDEKTETEVANITAQSDSESNTDMNSQIKSPLPPSSTNVLGKKMNRPSCWSDKQLKYFKSENSWLRIKNGKLGCDVCTQVGRLNVKKRMGVSVSPEWTNFSITHYGTTLLQQQRSLRKKVFEHRKSMAHKMSEHILEHCKLSCKTKSFTTNSEEFQRNTPTPAPRIMDIEPISLSQDNSETQLNEDITSQRTENRGTDMFIPQIKLEETSSDEEQTSPRTGWLMKWDTPNSDARSQPDIREISSQTNDDIIRITEPRETSAAARQDRLETGESSDQIALRLLDDENTHNSNQERNQDSLNSSNEESRPSISIIRTSSNLISPNITQSNLRESPEDTATQTDQRKQSQTSQTPSIIIEPQTRSRQNIQGDLLSEEILQEWDLADFPFSYPLVITQQDQEMFKVFRTVYNIIKLNSPFTDFSLNMELQSLNGCQIKKNMHRNYAANICSHISLKMKNKLTKHILSSESSKFSIILEECNILSTETILVIYLRNSVSGYPKPVDIFLDMIELPTDTEKIFSSIISCLESYNLNEAVLKRRLISVCIDGASLNLGVSSKLPAIFHEKFPNIIIWHCSLQSLEPMVGNIVENVCEVNNFISFMDKLYSAHEMSPRNKKELANCAKNLERQICKVGNAINLKTVSSSFETVKEIWNSFSSLYDYFSKSSTDITRSKYEQFLFTELKTQLSSTQFVKNLGILYDALQEMNELSAELQQHEFSLVEAHRSLCRQIKIFECMINQPGPMTKKSLEAVNSSKFDNVELHTLNEDGTEIKREQIFTEISQNLKQRILSAKISTNTPEETSYDSFISELNVLYKKFWPDDMSITYGEEELTSICERFEVETRPVIRAFREFKETDGRILNENLEKLIQIINTVPVATTEYKRVFEKINSVLKIQSSVSIKTLSDVIFIQLYGPPLHKFMPLWYVKSWTEGEICIPENSEEPIEESASLTEKALWKLF